MIYDAIIVGAGPAGLTAAIYLERANKEVLVLEAITHGGQIINTLDVDNYPAAPHISGADFANNILSQAKEFGAEVKYEKVVKITKDKHVLTSKGEYVGKTIILATGNENRKLGLDNEQELIGKGISYCATCDGGFFKGKVVAVNGGGNTALEDTLYLSDICKKVYLIHRRDEFRGDQRTVSKLKKKDNVEFILNSKVTKLNAKDTLESIEITDNEENKQILEVSALFVAIGRIPENENFKDLIDVDENGYVIASEDCHTNVEGIFVAGDGRTKSLRQLVTAAADGAIAATEAVKYISNL